MGHYCCCGEPMGTVCKCDWEGWHDIIRDKTDIPKKDGKYQVRWCEDCENHEGFSYFSLNPKKWNEFSEKMQWEKNYWDGWTGWASVYAWKELDEETKN